MRFHRPNMVSCKIFTGHTRNPLVGAYLHPSTMKHLPDVEEALQKFMGLYHVILGDLNVDLDDARSFLIQHVADLLMEFSLLLLLLLVRSLWPHSMFIIGWRNSNPEQRLWGH